MTDNTTITTEQLQAYLDHELFGVEQKEVFNLINEDPELLKIVHEMRNDMDMIAITYRTFPTEKMIENITPGYKRLLPNKKRQSKYYIATAAALLLCLGTISGWFIAGHADKDLSPIFSTMNDVNPANLSAEKILIHVNTIDKQRVTDALNKIEEILVSSKKNKREVKLEFVASIDGLPILRHDSPYAERIKSLSKRYSNVEFMACGVGMEITKLKENNEILLLPEAVKIPTAVDEILKKLEAGWTYARL